MGGPGTSGAPCLPPTPTSSDDSLEAEGRGKRAAVLHQTKSGYGVCCPSPAALPAASPAATRQAGAPGKAGLGQTKQDLVWEGSRVPGLPARKPLWRPFPPPCRAARATVREGSGEGRAGIPRAARGASWSSLHFAALAGGELT